MKVRFIKTKDDWTKVRTGKGFFVQRLIKHLTELGVECVTTTEGFCDIDFHISRFHYKSENCTKKVLRLGPVHSDSRGSVDYHNYKKRKALKQSDAVIYQSEFSKKMCDKFIGKSRGRTTIIFNGAENSYRESKIKSEFKYNYLASTRDWIAQKRLPEIITAFNLANVNDSCLWIAGDTSRYKKVKQRNIKYLGIISQDQLKEYYNLCHTVIHGVYIDACPNAVVEELVNGCSVICGDQGGTKELGCDVVIKDKPWNFKAFNHKKTPKMNIKAWANAIASTTTRRAPAEHLYIQNIARQYKAFFEEVLNV